MNANAKSLDALVLLRRDHRQIEALFKRCEKLMHGEQPALELPVVVRETIDLLAVHGAVEEQLFYPAMRQALGDRAAHVQQSLEEHRVARGLMADLRDLPLADARFNARLTVLMELVRHHMREEEGTLFPSCREVCGRRLMRDIGGAMTDLRVRLERAQAEVNQEMAAPVTKEGSSR